MKTTVFLSAVLFLISTTSLATTMNCPSPANSSLSTGTPPEPWDWNPLSGRPITRATDTFVKADLLGAGHKGFAVACFYKSSDGLYSIWQQVAVGQPAYSSDLWGRTPTGFSCTHSLEECKFNVLE